MSKLSLLLVAIIFILPGCRKDTTPVPHQFNGAYLYKDYRKQSRGLPMTAQQTNAVLVRTDLKSTGDYQPGDENSDGSYVRFIYGGKYYWAYHTRPSDYRYEAKMYGPFKLP